MKHKILAAGVIYAFFAMPAVAFQVELVASSERVLARPHDLVLGPRGERLYVTDMDNNRITVLDPKTLAVVHSFGEDELDKPHDLVFDEQGRLLVADTGNSRIAVYGPVDGKFQLVGEYRDGLSWTEGVAIGPDGGIYATNVGDNSAVKLVSGRPVLRLAGSGAGKANFVRPHDIDIWGDKVYVADPGNNRVQVFDLDLRPLRELRAGFKEPKYMELDERGWLYVADQHNNRIKVFDDGENLVSEFGNGELNYPEGVEVVGAHIWISDTYNDRVVLYRRREGS